MRSIEIIKIGCLILGEAYDILCLGKMTEVLIERTKTPRGRYSWGFLSSLRKVIFALDWLPDYYRQEHSHEGISWKLL